MLRPYSFVLLAGLATVSAGCANPADGVPEAKVAESAAPAADAPAPAPAGTTYVIGEGSSVSFVGSKITGSHDGGFHAFDGAIEVVDGDPARSRVDVTIDTTSLWSDNDRLTGHLKSADFFDVETYPAATFRSTAIRSTDAGWEIEGDLDLHGVTRTIAFPATIELAEDRVSAKAEFVLKRFDWNIVYPGKPDDLIRDEVVVRLDLVAVPGDSGSAAAES